MRILRKTSARLAHLAFIGSIPEAPLSYQPIPALALLTATPLTPHHPASNLVPAWPQAPSQPAAGHAALGRASFSRLSIPLGGLSPRTALLAKAGSSSTWQGSLDLGSASHAEFLPHR